MLLCDKFDPSERASDSNDASCDFARFRVLSKSHLRTSRYTNAVCVWDDTVCLCQVRTIAMANSIVLSKRRDERRTCALNMAFLFTHPVRSGRMVLETGDERSFTISRNGVNSNSGLVFFMEREPGSSHPYRCVATYFIYANAIVAEMDTTVEVPPLSLQHSFAQGSLVPRSLSIAHVPHARPFRMVQDCFVSIFILKDNAWCEAIVSPRVLDPQKPLLRDVLMPLAASSARKCTSWTPHKIDLDNVVWEAHSHMIANVSTKRTVPSNSGGTQHAPRVITPAANTPDKRVESSAPAASELTLAAMPRTAHRERDRIPVDRGTVATPSKPSEATATRAAVETSAGASLEFAPAEHVGHASSPATTFAPALGRISSAPSPAPGPAPSPAPGPALGSVPDLAPDLSPDPALNVDRNPITHPSVADPASRPVLAVTEAAEPAMNAPYDERAPIQPVESSGARTICTATEPGVGDVADGCAHMQQPVERGASDPAHAGHEAGPTSCLDASLEAAPNASIEASDLERRLGGEGI